MAEREVRVAVIGAGMSGIGAAIHMRRAGIEDFVVLERAGEPGGTWRDNTYPGCACDVPTALYSYSFAPKPDWSRAFAPQEEIRRYLLDVAAEHGVADRIRCSADVLAAEWDEGGRRWRIRTSAGEYTARVLVSATGPRSEPVSCPRPTARSAAAPTRSSAATRPPSARCGEGSTAPPRSLVSPTASRGCWRHCRLQVAVTCAAPSPIPSCAASSPRTTRSGASGCSSPTIGTGR